MQLSNRVIASTLAAAAAFAAFSANAAAVRQPVLPVGQCVNIANHLEPPQENGWGGKRIDADDFKRIKAAGFQSVRIPVSWFSHSAATPPHAIDPAWMKRVDQVVTLALDAGLNVILDSHNFNLVHSDPSRGGPWLAAVWSQVAAHFKDRPTAHLWFEIENEPHDKLNNANLMAALAPALAEIRKTNPTRPVVIGGEFWSGIDSLKSVELPDDPMVYATFHYYEPFQFTHQGANWINPVPPLGRRYGGAADEAQLAGDVAKVQAFTARTGRVPFVGESGAHDPIPLPDRIAYSKAIHAAFAPVTAGVCQWGYTNTFAFWDHDKKEWIPGMLEAIELIAPR